MTTQRHAHTEGDRRKADALELLAGRRERIVRRAQEAPTPTVPATGAGN